MLLLRRQPSGWHIQQLIKLAAVAEAESQFSLVADADVVAVGPVADADLIVDGRALRPKYPLWKPHAAWSRWASRVLNLPPMDYQAALTPSVLASDAVRSLAAYVEACVPPRSRARIPAAIPGARRLVNSWRSRLISAIPWTEYELYDMFLAGNGSFERFHWTSPTGVPRLYADCVWVPDDFENWVTAPVEDRSYFFSVVQSNCNIPVEVIEERLRVARVLD
jgi:hypothetical protein